MSNAMHAIDLDILLTNADQEKNSGMVGLDREVLCATTVINFSHFYILLEQKGFGKIEHAIECQGKRKNHYWWDQEANAEEMGEEESLYRRKWIDTRSHF